jgi:hypothetical protein
MAWDCFSWKWHGSLEFLNPGGQAGAVYGPARHHPLPPRRSPVRQVKAGRQLGSLRSPTFSLSNGPGTTLIWTPLKMCLAERAAYWNPPTNLEQLKRRSGSSGCSGRTTPWTSGTGALNATTAPRGHLQGGNVTYHWLFMLLHMYVYAFYVKSNSALFLLHHRLSVRTNTLS